MDPTNDTIGDTLQGESDRGVVLIAAAEIEELLAKLLRAHMVDSPETAATRKALFEQGGSLGTFAAKINACLAFGVIPPGVGRRLNAIRKVRNICAHDVNHFSFEDPAVKNRVGSLTGVEPEFIDSVRGRFQFACGFLVAFLTMHCTARAEKRAVTPSDYVQGPRSDTPLPERDLLK